MFQSLNNKKMILSLTFYIFSGGIKGIDLGPETVRIKQDLYPHILVLVVQLQGWYKFMDKIKSIQGLKERYLSQGKVLL